MLARPSDSITHIIYKSGKPSTLTWYRKAAAQAAEAAEEAEYKARLAQDERDMQLDQGSSGVASTVSGSQEDSKSGPAVAEPKHVGPFIVGLSWVTKCKAEGKRVGEEKHMVDVKEEDVFSKVGTSIHMSSQRTAGSRGEMRVRDMHRADECRGGKAWIQGL